MASGRKRRRHTDQGAIEDQLLKNGRWRGLKEQQALQAANHSASANEQARAECAALLRGGWGALPDYATWAELTGER